MKHLFIIHGAILRKSTFSWMNALKKYFNNHGFRCDLFFWSGIPFSFFLKKASHKFEQFYSTRINKDSEIYVFAKSLGADILNNTYNKLPIKPKRILFVTPAFKLSNEIHCNNSSSLYTVILEHDHFVSRWEKYHLIKRLPVPGHNYVIENDINIDHHQINFNHVVKIKEYGLCHLYQFYYRIFVDPKEDRIKGF